MWARPDLLAELKGLGLLRSPALERSFLHVRQESFLPDAFGLLAYADLPLPVYVSPNPPTMPSARCLIAALDLLEPFSDLRVLIAGCRGGYPGALLAEIVGPDRVVVVETDEERRTRTSRRLQAAGFEAVRVLPALPPETFDRILVLDATPPRQLVPLLADPGFLIARGRGVHDLAFVKLVRQGGETVQMTFTEAPSDVMAEPARSGDIGPVDFGRLFAVEDLLAHAWEGRVTARLPGGVYPPKRRGVGAGRGRLRTVDPARGDRGGAHVPRMGPQFHGSLRRRHRGVQARDRSGPFVRESVQRYRRVPDRARTPR